MRYTNTIIKCLSPRNILANMSILLGMLVLSPEKIQATEYLTPDEAKHILWQDATLTPVDITLTPTQISSIERASHTHVRSAKLRVFKTIHNGWFILDQVIGKHENIDIAIALTSQGIVKGIEILEYRETYGDEIRHPAWLAQFYRPFTSKILKLDQDIKNISGATLSCRHITDGVNRWRHTWEQVLRHVK